MLFWYLIDMETIDWFICYANIVLIHMETSLLLQNYGLCSVLITFEQWKDLKLATPAVALGLGLSSLTLRIAWIWDKHSLEESANETSTGVTTAAVSLPFRQ